MMAEDEKHKAELPVVPPSPKDFWVLYAHAVDWQIILHNFLVAADPKHGVGDMDPKIAFMGFDPAVGSVIYYLSREHFPAETVAHLLGQSAEKIAGVEVFHLREFKDADGKPAQASWQTPNVDYWGRA